MKPLITAFPAKHYVKIIGREENTPLYCFVILPELCLFAQTPPNQPNRMLEIQFCNFNLFFVAENIIL